jgi:hypothetical protein
MAFILTPPIDSQKNTNDAQIYALPILSALKWEQRKVKHNLCHILSLNHLG